MTRRLPGLELPGGISLNQPVWIWGIDPAIFRVGLPQRLVPLKATSGLYHVGVVAEDDLTIYRAEKYFGSLPTSKYPFW